MSEPSRQKTAVWNTLFYLLSFLASFAVGVLLVPIYLRSIPADTYGLWLASGNILTWVSLIDPGLSLVLGQRIAAEYGRKDFDNVAAWAGAGMVINTAIVALFIAGVLFVSAFIPQLLKISNLGQVAEIRTPFILAGIGAALSLGSFGVAAISQGLQSSIGIGMISFVFQILRVPVIYILLIKGFGLNAIAIGTLSSGLGLLVGQTILMFYKIRTLRGSVHLTFGKVRELAGYLSFTTLMRVGSMLVYYCDLYIVNLVLGPTSVTIMRICRTAAETLRTTAHRPAVAIQAPLTHLIAQGNFERSRNVVSRFLVAETWVVVYVASWLITFNEKFIATWVGTEYSGGFLLSVFVMLAFVAEVCSQIMFNVAFAAGRITESSLRTLLQSGVFIVTLFAGVRWFGLVAVPLAMLISVVSVQLPYYNLILVRDYGFRNSDMAKLGRGAAHMLAGGLAAWFVCVALIERIQSLIGLLGLSLAHLAICAGTVFFLSRDARQEMRDVVVLLRRVIKRA
jgi:O-antigen/teichoic acid export membrane protein